MEHDPKLEEYPASVNDPGTSLEDGEEWYFWKVGDLKGRFRVRMIDGVLVRSHPLYPNIPVVVE